MATSNNQIWKSHMPMPQRKTPNQNSILYNLLIYRIYLVSSSVCFLFFVCIFLFPLFTSPKPVWAHTWSHGAMARMSAAVSARVFFVSRSMFRNSYTKYTIFECFPNVRCILIYKIFALCSTMAARATLFWGYIFLAQFVCFTLHIWTEPAYVRTF